MVASVELRRPPRGAVGAPGVRAAALLMANAISGKADYAAGVLMTNGPHVTGP
jgi:hypothetical protein